MAKVTEVNRKNTGLFALGHGNHEMSKHLILLIEVNVKVVESLITTFTTFDACLFETPQAELAVLKCQNVPIW